MLAPQLALFVFTAPQLFPTVSPLPNARIPHANMPTSSSEGRSDDWIMDSEALWNMCVLCDIPLFPTDIILHDENSIQATDVGSIPVRIHAKGKSSSAALQDLMQTATIISQA